MESLPFITGRTKSNRTAVIRTKAAKKQAGSSRRRRSNLPNEPQSELVVLRPSLVQRRVMRQYGLKSTFSSSAGGVIAAASQAVSTIITSLGTEFTNFAQEFQSYRVKSMKVRMFPATVNATSTTGPFQGGMLIAPWSQFPLTADASILQSNQLVKFSTLEEKEIEILNPLLNTKLWNEYGVAYPADRDFGFSYSSIGTLAASSVIYYVLYQLEVEHQAPQ